MRRFENLQKADEQLVRCMLDKLADKSTGVEDYRDAFSKLGVELGKILTSEIEEMRPEEIMLVCASEDADWLATGVECGIGKGDLKKSVYWSTRETVYEDGNGEKLEISPIVKAYEEPIENCRLLVVVKSIISSSCVVKTQLTRLIGKVHPERIAILAPVMYKDGMPNLMSEFPESVNSKFEFFTFAIDEDRLDNGEVVPGIGGMVYPRLGLGDIATKNSYIPEMVLNRL